MISKINHIGIAVKNIEDSLKNFEKIFTIEKVHFEEVKEQKVIIASFIVGGIRFELTEPTSKDSPVAKFLDRRGEGIHHIAFESTSLSQELQRLSSEKIELINETPTTGAHEMKIAFIHPRSTNGILIELCEKIIKGR